mmetsp:Transcript_93135/g.145303  ORF Transcript_93135/g.145303 Transcript_93135/m.145303 type:complete len:115 (+) Transcript_93135:431-775(+)
MGRLLGGEGGEGVNKLSTPPRYGERPWQVDHGLFGRGEGCAGAAVTATVSLVSQADVTDDICRRPIGVVGGTASGLKSSSMSTSVDLPLISESLPSTNFCNGAEHRTLAAATGD